MDALPRAVLPLVEQLLGEGEVALPAPQGELPEEGERVWMPRWSRGIYCTLPGSPPRPNSANGCHTDSHPLHIGAVGYIDDVEPNSGALMVWDKSHRAFFPTFEFQYSSAGRRGGGTASGIKSWGATSTRRRSIVCARPSRSMRTAPQAPSSSGTAEWATKPAPTTAPRYGRPSCTTSAARTWPSRTQWVRRNPCGATGALRCRRSPLRTATMRCL